MIGHLTDGPANLSKPPQQLFRPCSHGAFCRVGRRPYFHVSVSLSVAAKHASSLSRPSFSDASTRAELVGEPNAAPLAAPFYVAAHLVTAIADNPQTAWMHDCCLRSSGRHRGPGLVTQRSE